MFSSEWFYSASQNPMEALLDITFSPSIPTAAQPGLCLYPGCIKETWAWGCGGSDPVSTERIGVFKAPAQSLSDGKLLQDTSGQLPVLLSPTPCQSGLMARAGPGIHSHLAFVDGRNVCTNGILLGPSPGVMY